MQQRSVEGWVELASDLSVLALSREAGLLYGLEEQAVLGRPLADVLWTDSGRIDWERLRERSHVEDASARLMLHRSCSGLRVWVQARLEEQERGLRLWVRRASGREVLEGEPGSLYQSIGRMLAVGGIGLWLDDRITDEFDWSAQARALHDLGPDTELSPAVLFAQIHPDDRGQAAAEIQRGIAERIPYDGVIRVKQGAHDYRHLHVFGGTMYDAEGVALLSLGGARDVSGEIASRRRVAELEEQLRAAQRGDVVGRLAGGIAHDFNNILTGILGCCEMLADEGRPEADRRDIEQIRTATLRAADLTRQLLAFGRRQALQRRAVRPGAVLEDVVSLLRRTLPENVELELHTTEGSGRVLVDVTQLHQVLTNLIVNAAQAIPDGGKIEIRAAQVSALGQERTGDFIRFSVEDSGPGVPPELRARIFEPFFTTKAPGQGSGLGLSVVQGIVEQHQGQIELKTGMLGGARFEVYLPVVEASFEVSSEAPHRRPEIAGSGLRVMLVEDEKLVRELTKRILVGAGFSVVEAVDAEEALARIGDIELGNNQFDVLLTDVVLRSMSGPQLVRHLRDRGFTARVVYMSGYPADFVESRVQLGPSDVLVHKPFTAAALIRTLRQA